MSSWLKIFREETLPRKILELRSKLRYYRKLKRKLDLKDPKDLNEKMQWLKIYSDTSLWTRLADKYSVREYVAEVGCEENLIPMYGVWDNADKINFDELPDRFILKTTHGSGGVMKVESKAEMDENAIRARFRRLLKKRFGWHSCEPHYLSIKPRIVAEELLQVAECDKELSNVVMDYKVWCFGGKVKYIWVINDRVGKSSYNSVMYDSSWNVVDGSIVELNKNKEHTWIGEPMKRPPLLDELIRVAERLSEPFPCVRVDLYITNDKVYFGEITFMSGAGLMKGYTREFMLRMGSEIDLNYKSSRADSSKG